MKIKNHVIGILTLGLTATAHGGTMGPIAEGDKNVVILSGGPAWPFDVNGKHSLYFSSELSRTYTVNNSTSVLGEGELFAGRQHSFNPKIDGQLGIVLATASPLKLSGSVWDFADPRFDNYRYSYKVQPNRIALGGKLLWNKYPLYKPWINASIGVSINHAFDYRIVPIICEAIVLPQANLSSHTMASFTYSAGAGIQRILTPHWQVGAGYEFTDWGRSELHRAPAQPHHSNGLTLNHLYTNALLFNLTWTA